MEFSLTFLKGASMVYTSSSNWAGAKLSNALSLGKNNVFNRFLITKTDKDEIDIPLIARRPIEDIISSSICQGEEAIKEIVLPLYENSYPFQKGGFDNAIYQFFYGTDYNRRLQKIILNNTKVYGGNGVIFDSDYNLLILFTLRAKKRIIDNELKFEYFKPVIYVNPLIFENLKSTINKGIVKKIIPYFTKYKIIFPTIKNPVFQTDSPITTGTAIVVIENLNRFIVTPTVPKPQSCTQESLNECLIDNIDDILALI